MHDTFILNIELGNAAMSTPADVSRALSNVAVQIDLDETEGKVRDENGNTVGSWSVSYPQDAKLDVGTRVYIDDTRSEGYIGDYAEITAQRSNGAREWYAVQLDSGAEIEVSPSEVEEVSR